MLGRSAVGQHIVHAQLSAGQGALQESRARAPFAMGPSTLAHALFRTAWQFCATCRAVGIKVPLQRVRALQPSQHQQFENTGGRGLWSEHGPMGADNRFRLINQTQKCTGPRLIVLQAGMLADDHAWAQIPARWLAAKEPFLRLIVTKGTLAPAHAAAVSSKMAVATDLIAGTSGVVPAESPDSEGGHALKRSRSSESRSSPRSESLDSSSNLSQKAQGEQASFTSGHASDGRASEDGPPCSAGALAMIHEQLSRLVVDSIKRPIEEQEAMGEWGPGPAGSGRTACRVVRTGGRGLLRTCDRRSDARTREPARHACAAPLRNAFAP